MPPPRDMKNKLKRSTWKASPLTFAILEIKLQLGGVGGCVRVIFQYYFGGRSLTKTTVLNCRGEMKTARSPAHSVRAGRCPLFPAQLDIQQGCFSTLCHQTKPRSAPPACMRCSRFCARVHLLMTRLIGAQNRLAIYDLVSV